MGFSVDGLMVAALTLVCGFTIGAGYANKRYRESLAFPIMFGLALLFYGSFSNREGWPTRSSELPSEFIFIHGIVREPDPVNGVSGAIWVTLRNRIDPTKPFTYELPYSPGLASDVVVLQEVARIKGMEIPVKTKKGSTEKDPVKVTAL